MPLHALMAELGSAGRQGGRSRQQRLYDLLRRAILDGVLTEGFRLPGSRELARDYGLSRNTVIYAYELLRVEGFVLTERRRTRVAKLALAGTRPCAADCWPIRGMWPGSRRPGTPAPGPSLAPPA